MHCKAPWKAFAGGSAALSAHDPFWLSSRTVTPAAWVIEEAGRGRAALAGEEKRRRKGEDRKTGRGERESCFAPVAKL